MYSSFRILVYYHRAATFSRCQILGTASRDPSVSASEIKKPLLPPAILPAMLSMQAELIWSSKFS
jgi:hypothetical protein